MTTSKQTDQPTGDSGGRYGQVNVFQAEHSGLPVSPANLSIADERSLRKRELAATFRLFGEFGFSEGVAGHVTARDPEYHDCFGSTRSA